jgi:tellurite methyltransferase
MRGDWEATMMHAEQVARCRHPDEKANPYDQRYSGEECYWGTSPSALCDRVIELVGARAGAGLSVIDLGCGEGRNAVYFARHGFRVTGLDSSLPGLEKMRRLATEAGVAVETVHANATLDILSRAYDVVFSTGFVHYVPPERRREWFEHLKAQTAPGGLNAHSALVGKSFLDPAPDADAGAFLFTSGELMGYYGDWEIVYSVEEIFDCMSSGIPHKHAVNRIVARRWQGASQ